MRKTKKFQKARRHAKRLKRLEMEALSEGDLHLSKTVGPNKNREDGLHAEDAPSSPVTRLTRLKVANTAPKCLQIGRRFYRESQASCYSERGEQGGQGKPDIFAENRVMEQGDCYRHLHDCDKRV
ncbi:hypothetical protein COL26b_011421 [Colletotrichum chrysophilum]|uniref:uncharacterized protein n=1 Tax=Colletotrichum chrysophilum TaxID=1836956 RepID=UPI0023001E88|nr:uncharacterized protein COL26b_011421 [Colletotrichum chrysophilum]KAJ0345841.1 hypothetical protein KNSL1_008086 [Colletotrichum chrysophilum]KAJ0367067.1 hypothetical protein COL26b_011421 [Colletotrichum chrysophilum]